MIYEPNAVNNYLLGFRQISGVDVLVQIPHRFPGRNGSHDHYVIAPSQATWPSSNGNTGGQKQNERNLVMKTLKENLTLNVN